MKRLFVLNIVLAALIHVPGASAQVAEVQGLPAVRLAGDSLPKSPGRAANFLVGVEVIVPQFIIGGEWSSTLRLVNNGTAAINAKEGYFFDNEGQSMSATFGISGGANFTDRGFSYTLPPEAVLEVNFTGTQTTQFGHIRLIDGCPLADSTCSLYGEVVLRNRNSSRPDFESVFPLEMPFPNQQMFYDHRNGVGTSLYLVNSNTSSDTVTLMFGNPANGLIRSVDVTVPGLGSRIVTLHTLAPETVGAQGVLYIRAVNSEGTVALMTATGLRINPSNSFTPLRPYVTKNQLTR